MRPEERITLPIKVTFKLIVSSGAFAVDTGQPGPRTAQSWGSVAITRHAGGNTRIQLHVQHAKGEVKPEVFLVESPTVLLKKNKVTKRRVCRSRLFHYDLFYSSGDPTFCQQVASLLHAVLRPRFYAVRDESIAN
jgi:hypothetical protein